jgi:hypothetical protein
LVTSVDEFFPVSFKECETRLNNESLLLL